MGNKSYYFTFPIHFHSGANTPVRLLGVGLFSKTKTGIRKLRSFQRLITITLTNSFKTASTESLLVLASVIPIDYHVLDITAARSFGDKIRPFFKYLAKPFGTTLALFCFQEYCCKSVIRIQLTCATLGYEIKHYKAWSA